MESSKRLKSNREIIFLFFLSANADKDADERTDHHSTRATAKGI